MKNTQLLICKTVDKCAHTITSPIKDADASINGSMLQKMEHEAHLMEIRLKAIKEREGWQTEQDMRLNWSRAAIIEHFDMYYKMFESNTPNHVIRDAAFEELSDMELMAMMKRWRTTELMEILQLEGFLTFIGGYFILSLDMFLGCNE